MNSWTIIANQTTIDATVAQLAEHGIDTITAENQAEAKTKILEMIPNGAEVMTMTSVTLDTLGITTAINESENYTSVKAKLAQLDRATQYKEMQQLGASPEWTIGSVHAVTEDGKVVIASNTGSQLAAYVYGSSHVIWVVGAQKIVKNLDEAIQRIEEHVLPLESKRVQAAYGMERSNISKLLIVNNEVTPHRITVVIVKEALGF